MSAAELAPGMRLAAMRDQRLGGSYSHIDGILAAVARGEARRALTPEQDSTTMRTGTASTPCPRKKEDV